LLELTKCAKTPTKDFAQKEEYAEYLVLLQKTHNPSKDIFPELTFGLERVSIYFRPRLRIYVFLDVVHGRLEFVRVNASWEQIVHWEALIYSNMTYVSGFLTCISHFNLAAFLISFESISAVTEPDFGQSSSCSRTKKRCVACIPYRCVCTEISDSFGMR
jgi:hypothetical protein